MSWVDLQVVLTAAQRLHLGADRDGSNVLRSHAHVPGGLVRAALARRWILDHGVSPQQAPAQLRAHFEATLETGLLPGPLWLAGTRLTAISQRGCKRPVTPACAGAGDDEAAALLEADGPPARGGAAPRPRCPGCGGPLEHAKGTVVGATGARSHQRNAIDAHQLVPSAPADPQVFTVDTLPAGSCFTGVLSLWAPTGTDSWLQQLLGAAQTVFVGGDLSVYGRCELELTPAAPPAPAVVSASGQRVAFTLLAPAVLTDVYGAPRLTFQGEDFPVPDPADHAGSVVPQVERTWRRTSDVTGWHLPSRMPKPVDQALAMGSTVLLRYPQPLSAAQRAHLGQLRAIGHRTSEGYGRLALVAPPAQPGPPGASGSPGAAR